MGNKAFRIAVIAGIFLVNLHLTELLSFMSETDTGWNGIALTVGKFSGYAVFYAAAAKLIFGKH